MEAALPRWQLDTLVPIFASRGLLQPSSRDRHGGKQLLPASAGLACLGASRRRMWHRPGANRMYRHRCAKCSSSASENDGAGGDEGEGKDASVEDDEAFFAAFRKRAQEVEQQALQRRAAIDKNWKDGRADVKVGAIANDWVRRVILVDDELFVGTATRGIQRYGLGGDEPRQIFSVSGDPTRMVPADHQAESDPETSVTSIAWNGRCLFAGLAGGRVHAWREDGTQLLDVVVSSTPRPCFVHVHDGTLIAAAGEAVMRWPVEDLEQPQSEQVEPHMIEVSGRVHSLTAGFTGTFALGLDDGTVELRSLERMSLKCRRPGAHRYPVSALLVTSDSILTGDAAGNIVSWRAEASIPGEDWEKLWQREHRGRVVAITQGGGGVIVSAALDSFVRVWAPMSGELLFAIPEHRVWLGSLSLSPDYSLMATDGRDNAVYLYRFFN